MSASEPQGATQSDMVAGVAMDVCRRLAQGHVQSLGPDLALFLARCIVDGLASVTLPGDAPPSLAHAVKISRAGSEAMLATIERLSGSVILAPADVRVNGKRVVGT